MPCLIYCDGFFVSVNCIVCIYTHVKDIYIQKNIRVERFNGFLEKPIAHSLLSVCLQEVTLYVQRCKCVALFARFIGRYSVQFASKLTLPILLRGSNAGSDPKFRTCISSGALTESETSIPPGIGDALNIFIVTWLKGAVSLCSEFMHFRPSSRFAISYHVRLSEVFADYVVCPPYIRHKIDYTTSSGLDTTWTAFEPYSDHTCKSNNLQCCEQVCLGFLSLSHH